MLVDEVGGAEVGFEAFFFAADLEGEEGDFGGEDGEGPPGAEPDEEADVVEVDAQEHRVTGEAIWAVGHQVLGARGHFVVVGVEGVALAYPFHVDDGPDAQGQAREHQRQGDDDPARRPRP